ncbi:hypothetical protein [Dichelobacter nodosus]|uniref:VirB7 n=1 Tax=Dichelobacter nodosus TaxID=870 RepID=Q5I726_DICNO|nr:hypothetical protein [Dichelobacter nodosus]AAW31828.1 VirB7 [Dichelobacter nodosus]
MKSHYFLLLLISLLTACSAHKTYESTVFPEGDWRPINPEHFTIKEAKKIQDTQ